VVEFKYAQGRIPESIQFISEEIREFEQDYLDRTWREYQEDKKLQKLVDRTVENILTALIEVCGTFLTQRGKASDNYADVLRISAGVLGLTTEERDSLAVLVIQRNRLAHRYLDLRWQAVCNETDRGVCCERAGRLGGCHGNNTLFLREGGRANESNARLKI
jgi:uncharacterized protein YutE (UPF0331/DUF86 family)